MQSSSMYDPQGPLAGATVDLFNTTLIICAVILALVTCLVTYCVWRFRGRDGQPEPRQIRGHRNLEILWTAGPFLILVYLFVLTVRAMHATDPPKLNQEPDLVIVGRQFWWEVRYPKHNVVTANEIHLPTGRKLLARVETGDVIHSFWVPPLGRKMDMMPDRGNYLWLQANQPGTFLGACSEFCGTQHAWMRITVTAQDPPEFERWVENQQAAAPTPSEPAAIRGAQLFQEMTCVNCHTIRGFQQAPSAGPDLTHVGSRRTLGAGVVSNTPANLERWIRNPQATKPGNQMPRMEMTDAQARDLMAYLATLK